MYTTYAILFRMTFGVVDSGAGEAVGDGAAEVIGEADAEALAASRLRTSSSPAPAWPAPALSSCPSFMTLPMPIPPLSPFRTTAMCLAFPDRSLPMPEFSFHPRAVMCLNEKRSLSSDHPRLRGSYPMRSVVRPVQHNTTHACLSVVQGPWWFTDDIIVARLDNNFWWYGTRNFGMADRGAFLTRHHNNCRLVSSIFIIHAVDTSCIDFTPENSRQDGEIEVFGLLLTHSPRCASALSPAPSLPTNIRMTTWTSTVGATVAVWTTRRGSERLGYPSNARRKRAAREVHKASADMQKMVGHKAKMMHAKRHSEKVQMRKQLKAHDERNVKQKDDGAVKEGALPTYLLDREGQKDAKALSSAIKDRRKDRAAKYSVPLPKVRGIAEEEMFKVIKTGKSKQKSWKRMVNKATFVGEGFTRKPVKLERFIRPMGLVGVLMSTLTPAHDKGECHPPRTQDDVPAPHPRRQEEPPVAVVYLPRRPHQGYDPRGERLRVGNGHHWRKGRLVK